MTTTQGQKMQNEFSNVSQSDKREDTQNAAGESVKKIANEALTQIKEKTSAVLSEQKSGLTGSIKDVAGSIRQVAENLNSSEEPTKADKITAQYGNNFAQRLERISNYLENANLKDVVREVEGMARRQPALFIAGAFAVGLLAARFLKTSHPLDNFSVALREDQDKNPNQQPAAQSFEEVNYGTTANS